jgi:hypothetical protein
MTRKHDIEARLDRALEKHIAVPRLDGRFDASVWARIESEQSRATNPVLPEASARVSRVSRWLSISNTLGIAVAAALALYFGLQMFSGVEVNFSIDVPLPELPAVDTTLVETTGGYVIGLLAIAFGLAFTSLGRRVRSSLNSFL